MKLTFPALPSWPNRSPERWWDSQRTSPATRYLRGVVGISLVLVAWQAYVSLAPESSQVPAIREIVTSASRLLRNGDLLAALIVSLRRILTGFLIASAIGLLLGVCMGSLRAFERIVDPIVQSLRSVAPIAVLPLFILWFGQGDLSASCVVAYAATFPIIVNTVSGLRDVDRKLVDAGRTLGLSPIQVLLRVMLPASVAQIITGMRLGMGWAWGSIVAAELAVGAKTATSGGIGQLMFASYAYQIDSNELVVYMIAVGLVGFSMDRLFHQLARIWTPSRVGV